MNARSQWCKELGKLDRPRVLEVGVKGWHGRPARHHLSLVLESNPQALWSGMDLEPGECVSIVGDAHEMSKVCGEASFDAIFCASVLEHLRRPWIAAREMALTLKPGGLLYVQSHQSFPIHNYPRDYFRFTIDAMHELFAENVGFRMVEAEYLYPCKVVPLENVFAHAMDWDFSAPASLNVECFAVRIP